MTFEHIGIVDYGAGNVENVFRAFRALDVNVDLVSKPSALANYSHLVIPGVGAFDFGMNQIIDLGFKEPIKDFVNTGKPLLGICLGMHMLADYGHENGGMAGLSLVPGEVRSMNSLKSRPIGETIPHMGWDATEMRTPLAKRAERGIDYYFAHSYFFDAESEKHLVSTFTWGEAKIAATVRSGNVLGVQYHPEKSGNQGIELLRRFTLNEC